MREIRWTEGFGVIGLPAIDDSVIQSGYHLL